MTTSTKSKPSTESDTATSSPDAPTQKLRWFRLPRPRTELPELNNIFDSYWGGSERKITGITLRIISVNAIALVILMIGIIYLGQYQNRLIETKLEHFETEISLIADSLSSAQSQTLDQSKASYIIARMAQRTGHHIATFDKNANILIDSKTLYQNPKTSAAQKRELESIKTLKTMAGFIIGLLPDSKTLPLYPHGEYSKTDVTNALKQQSSLSVWQNEEGTIILSAAAAIHAPDTILGAVLITREAQDIEDDITQVWIDIIKVFLGTLLITTLLSFYLSGVIAKPLRRLAKAAEAMRKGQSEGAHDIPDLGHRYDEIGELSIALRSMTEALWERMDTIEHFAADVAHELKNPLTSLKSALETLEIVKKDEDKQKLMDIIRHDLKRMDRLITDISAASRLDSELSREAFETIDMKTVLSNLIELYEDPLLKNATAKTTSFHLSLNDAEIFKTLGIESRLGQVFRNLIDNAISFAPDNSKITISLFKRQKNIIITIEDEGPGIPTKKLQTIFERFYSERPNIEDYGNNSGLGLSICKQIIDAHNGDIFAENITDESGNIRGARFSVILKAA